MATMNFPFGQYVKNPNKIYKKLLAPAIAQEKEAFIYSLSISLSANHCYAITLPISYKGDVSIILRKTNDINDMSGMIELEKFKNTGTFTFMTRTPVVLIQIKLTEPINISDIRLYNLINILIQPITRIGIQCAPHSLFCINGEEIYVGRTGLYELNTNITFVGVVTNNHFVIDYKI